MKAEKKKSIPDELLPLFEELEQEFLTAVKYIEALKVKEFTEWIGESRLLIRLREKAETLRNIRIEN